MKLFKDKNQQKRNSKKIDKDPLGQKAIKSTEELLASADSDGQRPSTAQVKRNSRVLSEAPKMTQLERKKMKHNLEMQLSTIKKEEEKTGQTQKQIEEQLVAD